MRVLGSDNCAEVRAWIYRNARPLEMACWRRRFEGGGATAVLEALSVYGNADGGYGHALEPDLWTPKSTPYTTLHAACIVENAGIRDPAHPFWRHVFGYLGSGAHVEDGLWMFGIKENEEYPHAPWWAFSPKDNPAESLGLTAEIAAMLLRVSAENTPAYALGRQAAARVLRDFSGTDAGEMGVSGLVAIAEAFEARGISDITPPAALRKRCRDAVDAAIERDTSKWDRHCPKPSRYIHSPDSPYYEGNEEIVHAEIEYLIDTRPREGVWPLDWSWFDCEALYPREWAIAENWWRAVTAIEKMDFLERFGRLE